MNWNIKIVILFAVFFGCKETSTKNQQVETDVSGPEKISYLIEVEDLMKIVNQPHVRLIDFRKPELYNTSHIEGALNVWRTDIEDTSFPYKGMMASPEQMESLFGNLGIHDDDTIIIYDDNGLCDASRLWWILQNYGFTKVKLFHGGITAWNAHNGQMTSEIPMVAKTSFHLPKSASMRYYISKEDVLDALKKHTVILDTRTDDEYSGKRQKSGAAKGGRIPGSTMIDWSSAIDYHGDMKLKPLDQLTKIYGAVASKEDTIIVYCHSGVRSAHTTFVLTQLLGYKNVRNYDGSWTEWSHFEELPFEKDSLTTLIN